MDHRTISIADQVFEILERDILTGVYARGEVLTETKLSEKLGVSRTPVREALRRMEAERAPFYDSCADARVDNTDRVEQAVDSALRAFQELVRA